MKATQLLCSGLLFNLKKLQISFGSFSTPNFFLQVFDHFPTHSLLFSQTQQNWHKHTLTISLSLSLSLSIYLSVYFSLSIWISSFFLSSNFFLVFFFLILLLFQLHKSWELKNYPNPPPPPLWDKMWKKCVQEWENYLQNQKLKLNSLQCVKSLEIDTVSSF